MKIFTNTQNSNFEFESVDSNGESFLTFQGKKLDVQFKKMSDDRYVLIKENQPYNINIVKLDEGFDVVVNGTPFQVFVEDEHARKMKELVKSRGSAQAEKVIKAQIPGLIVDVLVEKESNVKTGEPLLILEAMKMENIIKAPFDCEVTEIKVNPKDTVNQNQVLLKVKAIN